MTEESAGLHEGEVSQWATSSSSGCFLPPLLSSKPHPGFLSLTQLINNLIPTSSVSQNVSYVHSFLFSYSSPLLFFFFLSEANLSPGVLDPSLPLSNGIPRKYFLSSHIFRLHLHWLFPAYKLAPVSLCLKELPLGLVLFLNDTSISLLPFASNFLKRGLTQCWTSQPFSTFTPQPSKI